LSERGVGDGVSWRRFKGAGILFAHRAPVREWQVLLFRRTIPPDVGRWSIVGGRQHGGESWERTALREAVEEAFYPEHRPEVLAERLRSYLSPSFDIAACRKSVVTIPFVFSYHTFLVELTQRPPASLFRLNPAECDACEWFPASRLPPEAHRGVRWSVKRLGLGRRIST